MARNLYHIDTTWRLWRWDGVFWTIIANPNPDPQSGQAPTTNTSRWLLPWRGKLLILRRDGTSYRVKSWDGTQILDWTTVQFSQASAPTDSLISAPVIYKGRIVWFECLTSGAPYLHEWDGGPDNTGYLPQQLTTQFGSYTNMSAVTDTGLRAQPYRLVVQDERLFAISEGQCPASTAANPASAPTGYIQLDAAETSQQAVWKFVATGPVNQYTTTTYYTRWGSGAAAPLTEMDSQPAAFFPYNGNLYMISVTGLMRLVDRTTGALTTKYDLKTGTGSILYCGSITTNASATIKLPCNYASTLANRQRFLIGGKIIPASGVYSGVELIVHQMNGVAGDLQQCWCTSRAAGTLVSALNAIVCGVWMGFGTGYSGNGNADTNSGRTDTNLTHGVQVLSCEYGGYVYIVVMGSHTNALTTIPGGFPTFVMKWDGTTTAPTIQRLYVNTNQDPDSAFAGLQLDEETGTIHIIYRDHKLLFARHFTIDCATLAQTDVGSMYSVSIGVSYATQNFLGSGTMALWVPTTPSIELLPPTRDVTNNCNDLFYDVSTSDGANCSGTIDYNTGGAWASATVKTGVGSESLSTILTPDFYNNAFTGGALGATLTDNAAIVNSPVIPSPSGVTQGCPYIQLAAATSGNFGRIITPALGSTPVGVHVRFDHWLDVIANQSQGFSVNLGDPTQMAAAGPFTDWYIPGAGIVSVGMRRYLSGARRMDLCVNIGGVTTVLSSNAGDGLYGSANPSFIAVTLSWVTWDIWFVWLTNGSLRIRVSVMGLVWEFTQASPPTINSTSKIALYGFNSAAAAGLGTLWPLRFTNFNARFAHLFAHDLGTDLPAFYGSVQYRMKATR